MFNKKSKEYKAYIAYLESVVIQCSICKDWYGAGFAHQETKLTKSGKLVVKTCCIYCSGLYA